MSRVMMRACMTAAATLLAASAFAADAGKRLVFVACPIVRNTNLPCWMSAYQGELYYLGPQGDLTSGWYPPQFNHKVLVEATVSDEPRICGGVVLKDVVTSVLPLLDQSCNTILPAETYADPPNERGPGPSGVRGGTPPAQRRGPPRAAPELSGVQTFTAPFYADTSRMWAPAQQAVRQAAAYAKQSHAQKIEVVGYRSAIKLSDGTNYVEDPAVARERAETIARALQAVGIDAQTRIETRWVDVPGGGKGDQSDAEARKAVVTVTPGAAAAGT